VRSPSPHHLIPFEVPLRLPRRRKLYCFSPPSLVWPPKPFSLTSLNSLYLFLCFDFPYFDFLCLPTYISFPYLGCVFLVFFQMPSSPFQLFFLPLAPSFIGFPECVLLCSSFQLGRLPLVLSSWFPSMN